MGAGARSGRSTAAGFAERLTFRRALRVAKRGLFALGERRSAARAVGRKRVGQVDIHSECDGVTERLAVHAQPQLVQRGERQPGRTATQAGLLEPAGSASGQALGPLGGDLQGFRDLSVVDLMVLRTPNCPCELAGKMVSKRLYPERIDIVFEEQVRASHPRLFDRGQTCYDWQHYLGLLERKPGALRNGAPFADMPAPLVRLQRLRRVQRQRVTVCVRVRQQQRRQSRVRLVCR